MPRLRPEKLRQVEDRCRWGCRAAGGLRSPCPAAAAVAKAAAVTAMMAAAALVLPGSAVPLLASQGMSGRESSGLMWPS